VDPMFDTTGVGAQPPLEVGEQPTPHTIVWPFHVFWHPPLLPASMVLSIAASCFADRPASFAPRTATNCSSHRVANHRLTETRMPC
jgi:hypothetical protein